MAKPSQAAGAAATPPPGRGRKTLVVLVAAGAVLLLGGGGAAAYLLGLFGGGEGGGRAEAAAAPEPEGGAEAAGGEGGGRAGESQVVFVDLPDVVVNLQAAGARMRFLKLRVALEVPDEAAAQSVRALMPRLLDSFQLYLRALTVDDLSGPAGMRRLKEDLVARSNLAADPARVSDVLLKEMLVQ